MLQSSVRVDGEVGTRGADANQSERKVISRSTTYMVMYDIEYENTFHSFAFRIRRPTERLD